MKIRLSHSAFILSSLFPIC